jgi:hypothetical protein
MAKALVRTSANEFIRVPDFARFCPTELVFQGVDR